KGNKASKSPQAKNGNRTTFELDPILVNSPLNTIFLQNKKTGKIIDSLTLTANATNQPSANGVASSNSDDQGVQPESDVVPIAFYDAQILFDSFAKSKTFPAEILAKYPFNLDGGDPKEVVKNNPFFAAFLKIYETKNLVAAPSLPGSNSGL